MLERIASNSCTGFYIGLGYVGKRDWDVPQHKGLDCYCVIYDN